MMRPLIGLHRWLGVSFCLLFAMWFATGIIMHFVPFPALTESERIAGLMPLDPSDVEAGPEEAVVASKIEDVQRVRLLQRSDGPIYLVSGRSGVTAFHATNLTIAGVNSKQLAVSIALDHAHRRGLDASPATSAELAEYDQWTVPNGYDRHRPLYRIALHDDAGSELYVSSATGEVVLDTNRWERWWNYVGSVLHWIYPTALRSNWAYWDRTVWWLSLAAMMLAISGAWLGTIRTNVSRLRFASPYRGWHAWHHVLGLISMTFILTWIFSGWLSMDHGRLFSHGQVTDAETLAVAGVPAWRALPPDDARRVGSGAREVEWFMFAGKILRRERLALREQRLVLAAPGNSDTRPARGFLDPSDLSAIAGRIAPACAAPLTLDASDDYAVTSTVPGAPVYRVVCGETWFHIDGASGALLERLDASRRIYRWLYSALHTLDFPALVVRPKLRTAMIVSLCGIGLAFSLTGVVIGWRRLLSKPRRIDEKTGL